MDFGKQVDIVLFLPERLGVSDISTSSGAPRRIRLKFSRRRRRDNARNVSYTPNLSGKQHTISTALLTKIRLNSNFC